MTENAGGLVRPAEPRRESHDENPSDKPTIFQQFVGDVRHCGDGIVPEISVLAERQPFPARGHLHGRLVSQPFLTVQLQELSPYVQEPFMYQPLEKKHFTDRPQPPQNPYAEATTVSNPRTPSCQHAHNLMMA
jgi:hypothetical protein